MVARRLPVTSFSPGALIEFAGQSVSLESMSKIQAAVIGSGFIGPVHVEALRRAGIPVVGILDADPQRSREAAARLQLPKAYAESG